MTRSCSAGVAFALLLLLGAFSLYGATPVVSTAAAAARVLSAESGGSARVTWSRATGVARLLRLEPGSLAVVGTTPVERARGFLTRHGALFGLSDPTGELELVDEHVDRLGQTHLAFRQLYCGVPVFAAVLRVHETADGQLAAVNGGVVPGLSLASTSPAVSRDEAEAVAVAVVAKAGRGSVPGPLRATGISLVVLREGLIRGTPGRDRLAWAVVVADNVTRREQVLVDAHDGAVVDRVDLVEELSRMVHRTTYGVVIWREGDPLPYQSTDPATAAEVNRLIGTATDVHNLYRNLSGGSYLSYNGADATMHSVVAATDLECPNAAWDGRAARFCSGMVADDVIAHEWTHAYTEATGGLLYQWQPGALSESFSDIFGEVVDLVNGSGSDAPGPVRAAQGCSVFAGSSPPELVVLQPPAVAGTYAAGGATFNPLPPWSVVAPLEPAVDRVDPTSDGCQAFAGFTPGRVALVDRGQCYFRDKVGNALAAGAAGLVVVNNQGDDTLTMGGDGPRFSIPAALVGGSDGALFRAAVDEGLTVSLSAEPGSVFSLRWLIGEETAFGSLRDMWQPACFGDPARVTDVRYVCGEADNGGVHTNCGVPNRAFALLVDGGQEGGVEVAPIGLTRAAHVYWRAMSEYQVPTTDFADHADLLELACDDLVGQPLVDLASGTVSGEVLDAADCAQVAAAMAAVEMRGKPSRCGFQPLLAPGAPALVGARVVFAEDFETDPVGRWTVGHWGVFPEYRPRDWEWTAEVPTGGSGHALFALDSPLVGDCQPLSDDQSGVVNLDSPSIALPVWGSDPVLLFDHWVATEAGFDGGNLKLSVNGGPFLLVPPAAFRFNPYTLTLEVASNTNPLAGEPAFSGADDGSVEGSWGQSQVDLADLAGPGDTVTLRFDFGVDGCAGLFGWYVDNVRLVVTAGPRRPAGRVGAP